MFFALAWKGSNHLCCFSVRFSAEQGADPAQQCHASVVVPPGSLNPAQVSTLAWVLHETPCRIISDCLSLCRSMYTRQAPVPRLDALASSCAREFCKCVQFVKCVANHRALQLQREHFSYRFMILAAWTIKRTVQMFPVC